MTDKVTRPIADVIADCRRAWAKQDKVEREVASGWRYAGMIGDSGKMLRHYVVDENGVPIVMTDEFSVDYSNLAAPLREAVQARNHDRIRLDVAWKLLDRAERAQRMALPHSEVSDYVVLAAALLGVPTEEAR